MQLRSTIILRLFAAGALALSVAGVASAADTAKVRVLHASPDAPAVDVYLDGAKVGALTAVPFATISDYLDVPAGTHDIKVYATGDTSAPVIDANVSVAAGKHYTIAATGAVAAITAQVIEDAPSPACDNAQVRVVHFSADAPAVDVAPAGAAPADAVVKKLAFPDATGYLSLPAGSYDLDVRLAGTTTVALALPDVAIKACDAYSVFAIGSAATPPVGNNPLQAVVAVDATAKPTSAPTAPATDTIDPTQPSADGSSSLGGIVPVAAGLAAFAVVVLRPATRRVRQDQD
jgi:hypothetical protein